MSPQTVTPEPLSEMPKQPGLLRRGMRYYTNFKVPKELVSVFGKDHIREALGTSDYREACSKIGFQWMRWQTLFEKEQRQLAPATEAPILCAKSQALRRNPSSRCNGSRQLRKTRPWHIEAGFKTRILRN